MEALSKKGTPASARTGTGAGTARLAPPCTATESSLHLSAPYQCQLIRGQPFMADYRPAAAGRGVPATPRRHSVSCGTPFDSLRRAGRRSGRGQPCSLLISGFSLPGNALPGRAQGKFTLTARHLKLLQQGIIWENRPDDGDEDFWPVQGLDFKRPYGDYTYYMYEMAGILGEPYAVNPATNKIVEDKAKDAALEKLHHELLGALQLLLLYGEMPETP